MYFRLSLFSLISAILAIFVRETAEDTHDVTTERRRENDISSEINQNKWHSNSGFEMGQPV